MILTVFLNVNCDPAGTRTLKYSLREENTPSNRLKSVVFGFVKTQLTTNQRLHFIKKSS